MNACEKIVLYAQHELTPEEELAMKAHVQTCPSCQKTLALFKQLDQALVAPAAPADLVDRVFAKTSRKKAGFFSWKKIVAIAATVLIAAVVWMDVAQHTVSEPLNGEDLVAYMQDNLGEEYQWFEEDLAAMEEYFY